MSKLQGNTPEQSKNDSLNRSLSHGQLTMIAMGLAPVSYTHLTLPTNREV